MDIKIAARLNEIFRQKGFFDPSGPSDQASVRFVTPLMVLKGTIITPAAFNEIAGDVDNPNSKYARTRMFEPHADALELLFTPVVDLSDVSPRIMDGPRSSLKIEFLNREDPSFLFFDEGEKEECPSEELPADWPRGPSLEEFAEVSATLVEWTELDWAVFTDTLPSLEDR